jgi:hypothetical protein
MAPPTPPTTPPIIPFVVEERPPPLEELLSARDVDWGVPVEVLEKVVAKVFPSEVMVDVMTTVPTEGRLVVAGESVVLELWSVGVDEEDAC